MSNKDKIKEVNAPSITVTHTKKRLNWVQIWNKSIRFLLPDDLSNIFIFQTSLFTFNLQSTAQIQSPNLQKTLIFSVSIDGTQWTLDFSPDSVTIAVNDLDQNITISTQEIPLAAWQLLLSQKKEFLDNHLPRVPVTPNQQGTSEMREEVLSSVGVEDLDTSSYQLTVLEDIEFNWENSHSDMDAVFGPGVDNPFSPPTFDGLSMEGSVENTLVLDKEENKENSAPTTTATPLWASTRIPQTTEKSCFWSKNKICTRFCSQKFVSLSITGFVFRYNS